MAFVMWLYRLCFKKTTVKTFRGEDRVLNLEHEDDHK